MRVVDERWIGRGIYHAWGLSLAYISLLKRYFDPSTVGVKKDCWQANKSNPVRVIGGYVGLTDRPTR